MKIFFVDDAPFTRMLIKRSLESSGHETWGAGNGYELLEHLKQELPDLVLTDLLMEGLGGLEVLAQVKALYPRLPVIVVTADVQETTQAKCKALGAAAVFPKGSLYPKGQGLLTLIESINEGQKA
ncbi:MAG TPA: response regulator [Verrucomicrobia bacterium]|nr:response regulator [Verrucomicrobiota bacterium]